jgi:hypothetical protein
MSPFASAAILIYDHLLTLESEVKWVWLPRHRLATYWFFLVRYMAIVATATYATFYFGDFLPEVCLLFLVVDGRFISPQTYVQTISFSPVYLRRVQLFQNCDSIRMFAWHPGSPG